jgi:hypothetical protein
MTRIALAGNQQIARLLDLDGIAKQWARMINDTAPGLTREQRTRLYEIARPDRFFFQRSALNHLLELAAFSVEPSAQTWGAEAIRGSVVGRAESPLPSVDEAYYAEENANCAANIAQQLFRESRTKPAAEAVCAAFWTQEYTSRRAADSTWRAVSGHPVISVARR